MDAKPDCRQFLQILSEYVDETLDERLCAELEQHMAECEKCRVVVDTFRKTVELYRRSAEELSMPEEVRERLYLCLHLEDFLAKGNTQPK